MAKTVHNNVLDAALNYIKNNAVTMVLRDTAPTDYTTATIGALCTFTGLTAGEFTVADGTTSGRKITVAAQTGGNATADGNHNHTCLLTGDTLLLVTSATSTKAINNGDTVNTDAFDFEIGDPA